MKVLVATIETQGARHYDEMSCVDGELVWMVEPCPLSRRYPEGPCCCGITFSGMYSDGKTTTALVRDIEGLTREDYVAALRASHDNRPACTCPFEPESMVDQLMRRAERWPVGSVVGRRLERLAVRGMVDQPVNPR